MTIRRTPADVVQFTRESAERISRVVRESDMATLPGSALTFEALPETPRKNVFRMATFSGAWAAGTWNTLTLASGATVRALNSVVGLSPAGACTASIAKGAGTAWHLVQPNWTQQPGYSASGTQVLTVVNGNLNWVGVSTCVAT